MYNNEDNFMYVFEFTEETNCIFNFQTKNDGEFHHRMKIPDMAENALFWGMLTVSFY